MFLRAALPGLDPAVTRFVPHHVAHAASTALAAPFPDSAVLVCDGRGETRSHWAGLARGGDLTELAARSLPDSIGLPRWTPQEHEVARWCRLLTECEGRRCGRRRA